jgi:hypothetical protein
VAHVIAADILARLPDSAPARAPEELDARITAAFAENAKSDDVQRVLADVEAAAKAAEAAAEHATERALDPLVDDVIVARGAMLDAAFKRDRLIEAAKRLGKRVDELRALEKDRAQRAEHDRVLAERNLLAEEIGHMVKPIVRIAHLVRQIDLCDHEVGRVNAISIGLGHIPLVLSGAAPAIAALFQDAVVWDAFIAVAGLEAPPVASGEEAAKHELHAKRSASSEAVV